MAIKDFEKKWSEGTFPGWPVNFVFNFFFQTAYGSILLYFQKETAGALTKSGAYLDLSAYTSWEVN